MSQRQSDGYADVLAAGKLEQLLEDLYQANDYASMREYAERLVQKSAGCEFLITKGQVRITFDLKPSEPAPAESDPVEL